jgi:hypothetical protein
MVNTCSLALPSGQGGKWATRSEDHCWHNHRRLAQAIRLSRLASRGEPRQSAGRSLACRSSKSPGSRVAGYGKTASVRPQAVLPGPLFAQERSMRSEPGLLRIASGISVSDRSVAPHVGPLGRRACLGAAQAGYCCRLLFSRGRRVSGGPTLRHCGLGAGP